MYEENAAGRGVGGPVWERAGSPPSATCGMVTHMLWQAVGGRAYRAVMVPDEIDPVYGTVIRALRHERDYTIEEAAARAKLHPVYYGDIERSKRNPTLKSVDRVLRGLRCSWAEFGAAVDRHRQGTPSDGSPPSRGRS